MRLTLKAVDVGKLKPAQEALYAERRTKALKLSVTGHSYEDIAAISRKEGWEPDPYNSRQAVHKDVLHALRDRQAERNESAEVYLQNELVKLDVMEEAVWKVLRAKHYVVNQGVIVYIGVSADEGKKRGWHSVDALRQDLIYNADGSFKEPLEDDAPVLAACDRLIKIQDQRAKLTGIYAPVKKQMDVISTGGVDERIAGLLAKLGGAGQGETPSGA